MKKRVYELFLYKIDQINKLVDLIKELTEKYQLFIRCKNHKELLNLANKWGFNIGKRWGEY